MRAVARDVFSLCENVMYSGDAGMIRGLRPAIIIGYGRSPSETFCVSKTHHFPQRGKHHFPKGNITRHGRTSHFPKGNITRHGRTSHGIRRASPRRKSLPLGARASGGRLCRRQKRRPSRRRDSGRAKRGRMRENIYDRCQPLVAYQNDLFPHQSR